MKLLSKKFIRLTPQNRLYHLKQPIVALTGGIATGKSTVTKLIQARGFTIVDADALVKAIYRTNEAEEFVRENMPAAWKSGQIDFSVLRELVFSDEQMKALVESFIYARLPVYFKKESETITGQDFLFYDVPLLFEKHLDSLVDVKVVIYAQKELQLSRLIQRDQVREEIAQKMLNAQMDIDVKRSKADLVVNNLGTLSELSANVDAFLQLLTV